jgi:hypothetical protein
LPVYIILDGRRFKVDKMEVESGRHPGNNELNFHMNPVEVPWD